MSDADDAASVAALFAVDPAGLGGVSIRCGSDPARDAWLRLLRELLPPGAAMRRIPSGIGDDRLIGGLDLAATLRSNRPVAERGVLAASDGGVVVIAMAERLGGHAAASLCAALDVGEVQVQREGVEARHAARVGLVALDESIGEEERLAPSLCDRLAFVVDRAALGRRGGFVAPFDAGQILTARGRLSQVRSEERVIESLCAAALALGIDSPRLCVLAHRAARAAAALGGRVLVAAEDAMAAARLVLAPRATRIPPSDADAQPGIEPAPSDGEAETRVPRDGDSGEPGRDTRSSEPNATASAGAASPGAPVPPAPLPPSASPSSSASSREADPDRAQPGVDDLPVQVLEAARAAIPAGLLARIGSASARASGRAGNAGRAGAAFMGNRGRPAGVRAGQPQRNARLSVAETLRAAAPWQGLRGRRPGSSVRVESSDFRSVRMKQRARTLTIFAVDASGSAALHRLAEAKGAVELLLADCYVRRDQVAVISFRGRAAELLLPPTRSLVRAKRGLAGLPGGGGTPLAAAIEVAAAVAAQARRRGETPLVVFLTDGRANVARDGATGRAPAHEDALLAARGLRLGGVRALLVDTAPRPEARAAEIAAAMQARYVPLPRIESRALSDVVKAATRARP